jgi:hypothetical protein
MQRVYDPTPADARADIDRLTAEIERLRESLDQRWQPIETAPANELVLLFCPERGATNHARIELDYAASGDRFVAYSNRSYHPWATMWQPRPPMPRYALEPKP